MLEMTGTDRTRCAACKLGTMVVTHDLPKMIAWDSS
jgi:hypothetical protein